MRLVFVGSSVSLNDTSLGALIDSYDVVCRTDESYKLSRLQSTTYGTKTDCLFSFFNVTQQKWYEEHFNEMDDTLFGSKIPLMLSTKHNLTIASKRSSPLLPGVLPINHADSKYFSDVICCVDILKRFIHISELFIVGIEFSNQENSEYSRTKNRHHLNDIQTNEVLYNKRLFKEKVLHYPTVNIHKGVRDQLYRDK